MSANGRFNSAFEGLTFKWRESVEDDGPSENLN